MYFLKIISNSHSFFLLRIPKAVFYLSYIEMKLLVYFIILVISSNKTGMKIDIKWVLNK